MHQQQAVIGHAYSSNTRRKEAYGASTHACNEHMGNGVEPVGCGCTTINFGHHILMKWPTRHGQQQAMITRVDLKSGSERDA